MSTSPVTLKDEKPSRQDVLAFLEDLWQKLDAQIRSTEFEPENHLYLRLMIEEKVRIEQELSGKDPDGAADLELVSLEQRQHFIEVRKEAMRRYFEDALDRVPVSLRANWRESEKRPD